MVMNILIYCKSLTLGGGTERFAVNLGNELGKKGFKIYYLTFLDKSPKYDFTGSYLTFNENSYLTFNGKSKSKKNFIFNLIDFIFTKPYKIKKICKKYNIDLIIAVNDIFNCQAIFSKFFFRNNIKIIATHHADPKLLIKEKIVFEVHKFLYSKADALVCVSQDMERIFIKEFNIKKNILTIPNMLDVKSSQELSRAKISKDLENIFSSGFIFINIGRLSEQKGQLFLIKSFKTVLEKYNDSKLCIIGDSTLGNIYFEKSLKKLVKDLNLNNHVFFLGNQTNIFPFLNKSHCFVFSSLWEGFGLVLLEALSCNLPIISTDCETGPKEILCPELDPSNEIEYPYYGKYGILTEPFNQKKSYDFSIDSYQDKSEIMLSSLMIKMVENPKLKEKYLNGVERAKDFDREIIIKNWIELIKSISNQDNYHSNII